MGKVIGIDLGTTNSVVAAYHDGKVQILENYTGKRTTPSIVGFPEKGPPVVGPAARDQQVTNPQRTIYSIKRFMGRRQCEVASEEKIVPYDIVGKPNEFLKIRIGKKLLTPQSISAMLLRELKAMAEGELGMPVTAAVITVPAYFNDAQRQATRDAGEIAGLKVERIINEPTAAALAYGIEQTGQTSIIVFDFGGGTFDLSAMDISGKTFKVLGVHGNTHLGGDDFDQRIIDVVADDFLRRERIDLRRDPMALQRLKLACEEAKVALSSQTQTEIMLPYVAVDGSGPKHLQYSLSRERFEAICHDLFDDIRESCKRLMSEMGRSAKRFDEIVLVGGSTRIPKVQEIAKEVFRTETLNRTINPDEVVAHGAGVLAGVIQGDLKNVHLMDVTSHGFGIETAMGGMKTIISKNSPIPTSIKRVFTTPDDNQRSVPINVLEGESQRAEENRILGKFRLKGIRKAKRGEPQIEVEFSIDANGILSVKATDKDTGKSQEIVVEGGSGLERDEIDRMREESEQFEESREVEREQIDLCNHAEGVLYDVAEWLKINGPMLNTKDRHTLETVLAKLAKKVKSKDEAGVKTALKKLDTAMESRRAA